jgi:CheY-like chemotaxis protein
MSQGCILVVDDLPDWRATLAGILRDEGYEVCVAGDRQQALRLLEAERFHLAVLDVRLDEADEDNREGLELMRQIKAYDPTTAVIILTGYADVRMVQDALRPQANGLPFAYSFVEKPNSQELIEFVRRAFQREIRINWDLVIHADDTFQKLLARLRFTDRPELPPRQLQLEVDELLRKLFFTCAEITLYPLEQGFSGSVVFRVEPRYSHRGRGESVVAKIAEWPLIEREGRNFARAVQGVVGGHRLPQRLEYARTRSLAGLVYSFAGLGEATGFAEFYSEAALADIIPVLENLFLETCFPWGRHDKVLQPSFNFTGHYFSHLNLDSAKLQRSLSALFGKRHCLSPLVGIGAGLRFLEDISLVNPVEFILDRPLIGDAYLTLVHGDLTGYDVILDYRQETWLVDFAGTGQGLLLQDFASFENFIKFALLESDNAQLFYEWERELVNSPTLQPSARLLDLALPDEFSKAHQVILAIRRLAYQVSGDDHPKEYLIGLLFHALKLITILNLKPIQRDLALVSAALICQRLMADSQTERVSYRKAQRHGLDIDC